MTFHWRKNCIPIDEANKLHNARSALYGMCFGGYIIANGMEFYEVEITSGKEELKSAIKILSDFVDSL